MGAFDHVRMVSPPQRSLVGEVRAALALGYSPRCFSLQVRRSAELFGRSGPCADSAGQAAETTAQTHLETCVAEEHHKAYSSPFVDFSAVSWSCSWLVVVPRAALARATWQSSDESGPAPREFYALPSSRTVEWHLSVISVCLTVCDSNTNTKNLKLRICHSTRIICTTQGTTIGSSSY